MSDNGCLNSERLRFLKNWKFRFGLSLSSLSVSIGVVILVLTAHPSPPQTAVEMMVEGENSPIQFEPVCVDCAKLFKNPFYTYLNEPLFGKLHIEIRDGHRQCCVNDTDQMTILVDMILKDTQIADHDFNAREDNLSIQPAAAHKNSIGIIETDREFPGEHVFLRFSANNSANEYTDGVDVTPFGFRIIHSGVYYLYSSINFVLTKQGSPTSSYSTSVYLSRPRSPSDTGELLTSTHTGGQQSQETLFTGGVFHLQVGDLIQVCVSGRDIVNFKSDSTYTGLIMLASPTRATSTVKQ